ncbi:MAG: thymidine phosphorylase [Euryarchaeota archaeon]|nr:thymidine phosphorylase [Euryarchaeota archaeon]
MRSMPEIIEAKRDSLTLTSDDFTFICENIETIPREQLGAFLMACQIRGLESSEISNLTSAMLHAGKVLKTEVGRVDKHSTGGVGDKMSIILAPALRAAGATVPMLAGRGLAHTGGTIDKLESIPGFNTGLTLEEMRENPCFISRQTDEIAPADRILYSIRDITGTVPQIGLITASIISKKAAEGLEKLVLDVKCGKAAFMKSKEDAFALAKSMTRTGTDLGIDVTAQVTEMDNPIGMMFGNSHEIVECIQCLKNSGPEDTMDLVKAQASALGYDIEKNIADGSALKEFKLMCSRQGVTDSVLDQLISDPWSVLERGKTQTTLSSHNTGFISSIDALEIGKILCTLGAGRTGTSQEINHGVGITLTKTVGDYIEEGETWMMIDSESEVDSNILRRIQNSLKISEQKPYIRSRVIEVFTSKNV